MSIETIRRKKGMTFRAVVRIGHHKVSRTFERKTDAKEWEASTKTSRRGVTAPLRAHKYTFADLWAEFQSKYSQVRNAPSTQIMNSSLFKNYLEVPFGKVRLIDLNEQTWERYLNHLAAKGVSPGRVNRIRQLLHVVFNRALRWKLVEVNPISCIEKLKAIEGMEPTRFLSKVETDKLLQWLRIHDPWLYPKIAVLIFTGMRFGEMSALRVKDIQLSERSPHIVIGRSRCRHTGLFVCTKGKRMRIFPIGVGLSSFLSKHIEGKHPEAPLLWSDWEEGRWPTKTYQHFRRALKETGIPAMTVHQLRHSYSVLFLEGRGKPFALNSVLGHTDMKTTMAYSHFSPEMADEVRGVVDYHEPSHLTVIEGGVQ